MDDLQDLIAKAAAIPGKLEQKSNKDKCDVDSFISSLDIKKGSKPISKILVYDYYLQWSRCPLTYGRFTRRMNKVFGTQFYNGTKCWYLDPTSFNLPSYYSMSKDGRFIKKRGVRMLQGLKGVVETHGYYIARLRTEENLHYLGRFKSAKEAAIVYDIEAYKHFGKNADLNFPQDVDKYEKEIKKET